MKQFKKITSVILVTVLVLLQLTVLGDVTIYAAEGDTDIGCYEYGNTWASYSSPLDNYVPQLYGESSKNIYYVSPNGSDNGGNGSVSKPWATIGYAASQVKTVGSVIRLAAGSWTVNERVFLAPGVSLEGAGASGATVSTITSTTLVYRPDNVDNAIINLVSSSVVNGGQHVSGIRFDGGNRTASQAIEIRGRNNVAVHDCVFVDFECIAVGWRTCSWQDIPNVVAPDAMPAVWVKGGRFYNNTVTNCARYDSYARGALFCGGLEGFRIYNNIMTESNILGASGSIETIRGVPIKFWYYDGWMLDCKIYDNTIHKLNSALSGNDGNGWPFAIESICHYGIEICGNDIIGAIDLNFSMSGAYNGFKGYRANGDVNATVYDYASWIHDNSIHAQGADGWSQNAIILEYDTGKTIIEHNVITDCASVLYFTPRPACTISDVIFRYNQCTDIRFRNSSDADAIRIDGWDSGFTISGLSIYNNLLLCEGRGGFGFKLSHFGLYSGSNINIFNNIISGFQWNPLLVQQHTAIDGLRIQSNLFYGNGGWNGVNATSTTGNITNTSAIKNYINSGNVELNAAQWNGLFVDATNDNYQLKEGSVAIDAGWTETNSNPGTNTDNPFTDVSKDKWFFDDVMFAFQERLMIGVTDTLFEPNATSTRAIVATTIWRLEGKPAPQSDKNTFTDVLSDQWYSDAILWASENGIAKGYGDGLFGTNDKVTREQLAEFFYRYARYKGYDIGIAGSLSAFTDNEDLSEWAAGSMGWAIGYGLVTGKTGNILDPQGNAIRAEFAAMLHRFIK